MKPYDFLVVGLGAESAVLLEAIERRYEVVTCVSTTEVTSTVASRGGPRAGIVLGGEADLDDAKLCSLEIPTATPVVVVGNQGCASAVSVFKNSPLFRIDVGSEIADLMALLDRLAVACRHRHSILRNGLVRVIAPGSLMASIIIAWELMCRYLHVPVWLLPPPSQIALAVMQHADSLLIDTAITGGEALAGFLLANVVSLLAAAIFCHIRWIERSTYPLLIGLKSVPVVALAPLLVLWLGYGPASKITMAAIVAFFPLVVNATLGLRSVEHDAIDLFRTHGATKLQILLKLRIPTAVPYIFAALRVSATLAVVGAIVAELTGATSGIGFAIIMAFYNVDTPMLFAALLCASGMGLLLFALVITFEWVFAHRFRIDSRR